MLGSSVRTRQTGRGESYVWVELDNIRIYSVYPSSNQNMEEYTRQLVDLRISIKAAQNKCLIGGDLNEAAYSWGASRENERGVELQYWIAATNIVVLNEGHEPTYVRGANSNYIDVTLTSPGLSDRIEVWTVRTDVENLSDHRYINYNVRGKNKIEAQDDNRSIVRTSGNSSLTKISLKGSRELRVKKSFLVNFLCVWL